MLFYYSLLISHILCEIIIYPVSNCAATYVNTYVYIDTMIIRAVTKRRMEKFRKIR